jgi:trigger factor
MNTKRMGTTMDKTTVPLTVVRTDVEPCRVRLDIEVPVERVRKAYEDTAKAFNQQGRVAGFRPGKVPRPILLRQYGTQIELECRRELIRGGLREALEKEPVEPETTPRIENEDTLRVTPEQSFVFSLSFDVPPTFALPSYKGIHVSRQASVVADAQVEEAISGWLQRRASFAKVERPSQPGDLLKVSYEGTLSEVVDLPEASRFYLSARETWLALREPELIPGTLQGLVGVSAGQTRELQVTFPEAFNDKALAGKQVHYSFLVVEVHGAQIPELTEDLAKAAGAESVQQMRERVRESLKAQQDQADDQSVRQQILTSMLAGLDLPLPPTRLRIASYDTLMRLYDREVRRGATPEQLGQRPEELRRQADEEAARGLKRFYVLQRIAEAEKIEPDMERVNALLQYMATSSQVTPKVLIRRLRENGRLDEVVVSVREDMVLDRLVALADIAGAEGKKE